MHVLALDTTTRGGSAAIVDDDRVLVEREGDATRSHAERLPAELLAVLEAAGLASADVDLFAVAAGPGSFTGLRIGIATMQGLAFVHRRRMAAISALEALALSAAADARPGVVVGAWLDAHRHEVFTALYRVADAPVAGGRRLVEIEGPAVGTPAATFLRWQRLAPPDLLLGDGAIRYQAEIGQQAEVRPAPPLAGWLGRLAVARAAAGASIDPAAVQPLYIRRPDAEVAREKWIGR